MAWGLPKLPGLTFSDPTKTQHHMCRSLRVYQGYRFPDIQVRGPGGAPTDVDSNAFALPEDPVAYDPSLTYGRVKQTAQAQVIPNWVHYDKRCLNFKAFMKQPVYDNPDEHYRLRIVNIIYFLEDDTMMVTEPTVKNSGIWQGRMVTRGRIPKNDQGAFWHWKDLNVAKDICIYGKVFHTVSCDLFTREWLESQGIELQQEEDMPTDPYTEKERWKMVPPPQKKKADTDTFRRFLEYDGKVLAFEVAWDTRDEEHGELTPYRMYYFLQDDTISVKELHDERGGKDPFPLLLKKTKLPKKWKERPADFPSSVMETTDEEVTQYYSPIDLMVGNTVFVLGRRMLIYDCDAFTRKYYRAMLNIEQPPAIEIKHETKKEFKRTFPPHIGIGTPEDSIQSCYSLIPKPPHKDVIKYNLNARKFLRYLCELEWVHPEDKGREFVLSYSLADGTIKIGEIPKRNSGIKGATVPVFKHRFKITGCDLFVYRYMSANPEKFPPEVIDNVRNYHMREGNLKDELKEASREEQAQENRAQMLQIGVEAVAKPNAMQQCLTALNISEGSSEPARPVSPPPTTEHLSYEDSLRIDRQNKPTCDNIMPLKGILKSGAARDDHQKIVSFTGPAIGDHRADGDKPKHVYYPPGQQPHYDDDPNFCDRYKEPGAEERAANRAKDICQYEVTPKGEGTFDDEKPEFKLPGYLGTYGVDCKEVADYMRLAPDAYEKVKALRKEVPEISPAAVRVADLPRGQFPSLETCTKPPPVAVDPCEAKKEQDVTFACPHVTPKLPCCVPKPC